MIRVQVDEGYVNISKVEGTGRQIIAELCNLVNSVCTAFCSDMECSKEMTERMILLVSDALRENSKKFAKKVQND